MAILTERRVNISTPQKNEPRLVTKNVAGGAIKTLVETERPISWLPITRRRTTRMGLDSEGKPSYIGETEGYTISPIRALHGLAVNLNIRRGLMQDDLDKKLEK